MNINNFINDKLLDFFAFNQDGYVFYFFIAGVYLLIMFLAFGIYAFVDSRKRGVHIILAVIIGLFVFIFNVPALIAVAPEYVFVPLKVNGAVPLKVTLPV